MYIVEKMELVIPSDSKILKGCNPEESKEEREEVLR